MKITLRTSDWTLDVDVTIVDPAVLLGEVYQAITGRPAGPTIWVDGWPYRSDDALGSVPIRNGSIVVDHEPASFDHQAELTQIAGLETGWAVGLSPGRHHIGRSAEGDTVAPAFRVDLEVGSPPLVRSLSGQPLWADTAALEDGEARQAVTIRTGNAAFRLSAKPSSRPRVLASGDAGTVPLRRSPRPLVEGPIDRPAKPDLPKEPQVAAPFSWLLALAPIPVGLVVAVLFSPFFLVFALMSPVLSGARWLDGRRKARRSRLEHDEERQRLTAGYRASMIRWAEEEIERRRCENPDLAQLGDRVSLRSTGLWERRPSHRDFLRVVVGLGTEELPCPATNFSEADAVEAEVSILPGVPIAIDLASAGALGIVGPAWSRRAAAAAILADLAIEHGPADLGVLLLIDRDRLPGWDWVKWLPHLDDERGMRAVLTDAGQATAALDGLARPAAAGTGQLAWPAPVPVAVVDGDAYLDGAFIALSSAVRAGAARAIVLADRLEDLPAVCTEVLSLDDDGASAELLAMDRGGRGRPVLARLLAPGLAADLCRGLSAFTDPERPDSTAGLPDRCGLRSLSGVEPNPAALARAWADRAGPSAVIGVGASGPLTVDLVADGPHALIAGTTGAGKSELLRTLVASLALGSGPDRLNFVLVDFKGGGAFDACASLPHTVGVVTDLDEALAARALRCLKAELRHREHRLREAGVSDLRDLPDDGDPLPRLLVVIDEFATLAAELPEFMASLVDVAQRGRSLGIHLVLATQRPAGVVDAKVRANTNLRISLRVQDEADSIDVLGDKRAAAIDRRRPGRGYARFGASELTYFQTAIVSQRTDDATVIPLRVTTFDLAGTGPSPVSIDAAPVDPAPARSDLVDLVEAATEAFTELGMTAPRIPWPAPLPARIDAAELWTGEGFGRWAAPLGVVDRPDDQRTEVHRWDPTVGHLIIYGTDGSATTAAIRTLVIGLARGHRPADVHIYLLDFLGGGALSDLLALDHVGSVVVAGDDERLTRVVERLEAELAARATAARERGLDQIGPDDGFPLLLLAIANYGGLTSRLEEAGHYELAARFEGFVRDGAALGLHVVMTANQDRAVPNRVAGQIESKLVMRLADPNAYAAFGLRAKELPDLGRGRAIDVRTGLEVQIAEYPAVDAATGDGGGPGRVRVLESEIDLDGVIGETRRVGRGYELAIGRRHADLEIASIELRPGTSFVVAGPARSGKTTVLRTIAASLRHADPDALILPVTPDGDEWPGSVDRLTPDLLDHDRPTLVLIDGIAGIDDEEGRVIERLATGGPNRWFVLADRPELLQSAPLWFRGLAAGRSGILLRPQADHGEILRVRLPRHPTAVAEPGRGYLVTAGAADLVQVARPPEARRGRARPPESTTDRTRPTPSRPREDRHAHPIRH